MRLQVLVLPIFLVFAVCAFASSFSLRLIDPLLLPVAAHFATASVTAALLSPAYAIPYALAQPLLGPIGDRLGRELCMKICIVGLACTLVVGSCASSFEVLILSRVAAGIFGGGIIPLVLAAIGDAVEMNSRQVVIGRMLFAIIGGQMMGSVVAGVAARAFGWRSALAIGAALAIAAAAMAWTCLPGRSAARGHADTERPSFVELYRRVFVNPIAPAVFGCVLLEGVLFFGLFPFIGDMLANNYPHGQRDVADEVGVVLGAFGAGGLLFAIAVRSLLRQLGVRRMCLAASAIAFAAFLSLSRQGPWWQAALAMLACGLAFFMVHNTLQTVATELAPGARGSAIALFASALFLGQGIGPLVFGPFIHRFGAFAALIVTATAVGLLGQFVARRIAVMATSQSNRAQALL